MFPARSSSPATMALAQGRRPFSSAVVSRGGVVVKGSTASASPPKRTRFNSGSFDLSDMIKASQQVEDSIAFPIIEWPSHDSDIDEDCSSSDNDDDEGEANHDLPRKRHCRGLVRCQRSSNLCSLASMTSMATVRRGSAGSLA